MKFSYAIGNPPYQKEVGTKDLKNGVDVRVQSIFNLFQLEADKICNVSCLIYPGAGWIQAYRNGLQKFGKEQINDPHLKALYYWPNANEVFTNVSIGDGVSVVIKDGQKTDNNFAYIYISNGKKHQVRCSSPGDELFILNPSDRSIIDKMRLFVKTYNMKYIDYRVKGNSGGKSIFGIASNFVEKHQDLVREYDNKPLASNEIKLLTNDKSGKVGRAKWYVIDKKHIPSKHELFDKYKVVSTGTLQLELLEPNAAFGRSRSLMGYFGTFDEASNYMNYLSSKFCTFTLNLTHGGANLGKLTPDLLDYTSANTIINWTKDIDEQLYKVLGLAEEEIKHICDTVDKAV